VKLSVSVGQVALSECLALRDGTLRVPGVQLALDLWKGRRLTSWLGFLC